MYEIKITVSAPGLEGAIDHLADALKCGGKCAQPTATAPTTAAPASQGVVPPALANAPVQPSTPPVQPTTPTAPAQAPVQPTPPPPPPVQPTPAAPSPVQPTQPQPSGVTLEAIINAGAGLVERGMMNQVVSLLGKYGLQAVNQLQPAQYEPFAAELRALGAAI